VIFLSEEEQDPTITFEVIRCESLTEALSHVPEPDRWRVLREMRTIE